MTISTFLLKDEAKAAIKQMMVEKAFGDAGDTLVLEELLIGM